MAVRSFLYMFYSQGGGRLLGSLDLSIDQQTHTIIYSPDYQPPDWCAKSFSKRNCDCRNTTYCKAASSIHYLSTRLDFLPDRKRKILVRINTQERIYEKETTVQAALTSIIALALPFCGCPYLAFFRPMSYFHLPFATATETVFHATGSYFIWKFFSKEYLYAEALQELSEVYNRIEGLNETLVGVLKESDLQHKAPLMKIVQTLTNTVNQMLLTQLDEIKPFFVEHSPLSEKAKENFLWRERVSGEKIVLESNFLNQVINALSDPIFVKDSEHRWLEMNQAMCEFIGHPRSILIGKSDYDFFPKEEADIFWEKDNEVFKSRKTNVNEESFTDKDGNTHTILTKKSIFTDENGNDILVGVIRDITEHKTLQKRLAQSEKMQAIGQLAAGIAHEINTPAQFVNDNMSFMIAELPVLFELAEVASTKPEELPAFLEKNKEEIDYLKKEAPLALSQSQDGVERIRKLVVAMKNFSTPPTVKKHAFNLNKSIQNTAIICRNEWKYVAKVNMDLATELEPVIGHESEINQVLLNLIVNAAHAIEERTDQHEGVIDIKTAQHSDHVEIYVSDNGTGIPEHLMCKILEPFFTTKTLKKGTGQGLAIAYDIIVNKHGGDLQVKSEVGVGSNFIIKLPNTPSHQSE